MRGTLGCASAWIATVGFAAAAEAAGAPFTLSSPDIAPGGKIANAPVYNSFGCKSGNIALALSSSNTPAGTVSFALRVHDPDNVHAPALGSAELTGIYGR